MMQRRLVDIRRSYLVASKPKTRCYFCYGPNRHSLCSQRHELNPSGSEDCDSLLIRCWDFYLFHIQQMTLSVFQKILTFGDKVSRKDSRNSSSDILMVRLLRIYSGGKIWGTKQMLNEKLDWVIESSLTWLKLVSPCVQGEKMPMPEKKSMISWLVVFLQTQNFSWWTKGWGMVTFMDQKIFQAMDSTKTGSLQSAAILAAQYSRRASDTWS